MPGQLPDDGLATFWLASPWGGFEGHAARSELHALGVRTLYLYPCIVERRMLRNFLDRAWNQGLTVVPELPLRLFQRPSVGCFTQGGSPSFRPFDCYEQAREASRDLVLQLFAGDGSNRYHPAVEMVLIARNLDIAAAAHCEQCGLPEALRAALSAWDGLMDAENEEGINPEGVRITALLAGAADAGGDVRKLPSCYSQQARNGGCAGSHALRGLWLGANWMDNATYTPHNNLSAAVADRWLHTFAASSTSEGVTRTLREYYEFAHPIPEQQTAGALLEFGGM